MHMADALISPAIGGTMWATTTFLASYAAKKVRSDLDDRKVPLMGVLGAFVFAAQMINFTIPGTGSSGHLGGGMILAILLGPHAGFLTMASILTIQALFFADGGLLALGCNIFNLGFFPCYIAYPLLYKKIVGNTPTKSRLLLGISIASIIGLQLGAFGVVMETVLSGISELPFTTFVLLMQPIHLAIGLVEGFITAAVILFVWKEQPEILQQAAACKNSLRPLAVKPLLLRLFIAALFVSAILSWFASSNPDGLEWAIMKITGQEELEAPEGIYHLLADLQHNIAFFPDYNFREAEQESPSFINSGTSTAGIAGSILTLLLAGAIGKSLQLIAKRN